MKLTNASVGKIYRIQAIQTNHADLNDLLFLLGCRSGVPVMVEAHWGDSSVISIQGSSFNLERQLTDGILLSA